MSGCLPHIIWIRLQIRSKNTLLDESHTNFSRWSKQLIAPHTKIPFLEIPIVQSVLLLTAIIV